jgi:transcriptional regulator with XRE-family HTH domain/Zn finger protein HypA/HybF involved in hydrogenase expression
MMFRDPLPCTALIAPSLGPTIGAQREGLHSLFRRVGEKNQLSVNDLLSAIAIPRQGISLEKLEKVTSYTHLINRGAGIADKFIARIEALTTVRSSRAGTLSEVNELRGVGLLTMSRYRKWCTQCIEEDLGSKTGPYERLLWSVDYVKACPVHQVQLQDICPACGADKITILTGRDISGRCPKCVAWLGGKSVLLDENRDEYSRYLLWTAKSFSDLFDSPLPSGADLQPGIIKLLTHLSERYFNKVHARLAEAIERNKSVLGTWLAGDASPSWQALCEISFTFHIPLPDLLCGHTDKINAPTFRRLPLMINPRLTQPRRSPTRRNLDEVRCFLVKVEEGGLPHLNTMTAVATQFGVDAKELSRLLPEDAARLSMVLKARRAAMREKLRAQRRELILQEIPLAISRLAIAGTYPVRSALLKELGFKDITLSRPEMLLAMELIRNTIK